jgi:hypothetical protein
MYANGRGAKGRDKGDKAGWGVTKGQDSTARLGDANTGEGTQTTSRGISGATTNVPLHTQR